MKFAFRYIHNYSHENLQKNRLRNLTAKDSFQLQCMNSLYRTVSIVKLHNDYRPKMACNSNENYSKIIICTH